MKIFRQVLRALFGLGIVGMVLATGEPGEIPGWVAAIMLGVGTAGWE